MARTARTKNLEALQRHVFEISQSPMVSQKIRKANRTIDSYRDFNAEIFGNAKYGSEYTKSVVKSMQKYDERKVENLYAIVMPAGHGKTSLATRYGVMDIDNLVSKRIHSRLVDERTMLLKNKESWRAHDDNWCEEVRKTISLMDLKEPTVVLVHTELIAMSIGATVLGGMRLSKDGFENQTIRRNGFDKLFTDMNYISSETTLTYKPRRCHTFAEVEDHFLMIMNINQLPVAAPYKYSREIHNSNYASTCPEWVLEGTMSQTCNIADLETMFKRGEIPKECVDYYVHEMGMPSAYGFGVTMDDWGKFFGEVSDAIAVPRSFDTKDYADANMIFPFATDMERNRANMTIRRMIKVFNVWEDKECLDIAKYHVGERNVFVTSILLHWKGLMRKLPVTPKIINLYHVEYLHWSRICKELHNLIRTSDWFMQDRIDENTRQELMYMDLLVGRTDYVLTTEMALENRESDSSEPDHIAYNPYTQEWSRTEYKKQFEIAVKSAMTKINFAPRKVNVDSFLDFWERRASWLTKGSLVWNEIVPDKKKYTTLVLDDVAKACRELQNRHNKKSFFEVNDLIDVISQNPKNFNITRVAKKFEVGFKYRVLLPGSLMHYIVFSYVLYIAEYQEQIGSVRLNAIPDEEMLFFDRKMTNGLQHLLYDWKDFNAQHSKWEMARVILALQDIPGVPADYSMFVAAIAEGFYNMWLETKDGLFELGNGLFSGWRGTTWVNGWLNYCYLHVARQTFNNIYKNDSLVYVDHGGDDVDMAFLSSVDTIRFLNVMNMMKFDATAIKQMVGRKAEFFRITVDQNGAYGSCTRAMASFVAGDWEGSQRVTVRERVEGTLDQLAKLERRGLDPEVSKGCALGTLSHWCRIRDDVEWLNLPVEVLHGKRECGGLGVPDGKGEVYTISPPVPEFVKGAEQKIVPGYKASFDFVQHLALDVKDLNLTLVRQTELAQKMAEGSFDFAEEADHARWVEICHMKFNITKREPAVEHRDDESMLRPLFDERVDNLDDSKYKIAAKYAELTGYVQKGEEAISKEELISIATNDRVSVEALEFSGNLYYRRLVPEFWAYRITKICREAINEKIWSTETANNNFEVMCSMVSRLFDHKM